MKLFMLMEIETWAKATGASGIRLVSGSTRTGAHEFYGHCGYRSEKEQINFKKFWGENKYKQSILE